MKGTGPAVHPRRADGFGEAEPAPGWLSRQQSTFDDGIAPARGTCAGDHFRPIPGLEPVDGGLRRRLGAP